MVEKGPTAEPRLIDRVRQSIRVRHYSYRTEQQYVAWIRRFIRFHGCRHPRTLGGPEVSAFLTHLASDRNVAAATQNQALAALLFLYRQVLDIELPWLDQIVRSQRPKRLPVVLTRSEVRAVLGKLTGHHWLVASLLYGSGLRLLEALHLRKPSARRASRNRLRATPCVTPSQRTCSRLATTSVPFRSCWDTATCEPRRSTRMY